MTRASKVCAWIDVSNTFDPLAAAAVGLDLDRLLWVRCGASDVTVERPSQRFCLPEKYLLPPTPKKGVHGGGVGSHPRSEVKGLSDAVGGLLRPGKFRPSLCGTPAQCAPGGEVVSGQLPELPCAQETHHCRKALDSHGAGSPRRRFAPASRRLQRHRSGHGQPCPGVRIAGSVSHVASLPPGGERTQSSILLLTQHSCAKSSAELLLRLQPPAASLRVRAKCRA